MHRSSNILRWRILIPGALFLGLALAGVSWGDYLDGVEVVPLGGNCSVCRRWIPAEESCDCWLRSTPGTSNPSAPAPSINTQAAAEVEAKLKELQGQLEQLKLRRQQELLERARTLTAEINQVMSRTGGLWQDLDGQLIAVSQFRQALDEKSQLLERLRQELGQIAEMKSAWEEFVPRIESIATAQTQRVESRCGTVWAQLQDLQKRGSIAGPAAYRQPPPYVRPNTPDAQFALSGKGLELIQDRWSPGATRSDLEWRAAKDQPSGRSYPVAQTYRLRALAASPAVATESDVQALRGWLQGEITQYHAAVQQWDNAQATVKTLVVDLRGQNAGIETAREENKVRRRAVHVLETRGKQALREACVAKAQDYALDQIETMLPRLQTRRGWRRILGDVPEAAKEAQEMISRYSGFIGSIQQLKDFGQFMHHRFDPAGPMDQFFSQVKRVIDHHFDPVVAGQFESWLENDQSEFATGLIEQSSPAVAWLLQDLRDIFHEEGQ